MSYGPGMNRLSACHAEYLSVHPYFNANTPIERGPPPSIELISSHIYPAESKNVPVRLRISDSDELHQVILHARATVKACRELRGKNESVVEFDYDGVIPSAREPSNSIIAGLLDHLVHPIRIEAVDMNGNADSINFVLLSEALQPLSKISGDNQHGLPNTPLPVPFVVEVRDLNNGSVRNGVPVTFTVTEGGGTLSIQTTTTNANGRAESTLTLGPNFGINIISVAAAGIPVSVTFHAIADNPEYVWSIPSGYNLIHVPLKVTEIDGAAQTIESIGDLYDALGGANAVKLLLTLDSQTQEWLVYFGPAAKDTPADRELTDDMGIIADMRTPVRIRLTGSPLGINGNSAITLNPGYNLVGLPLDDSSLTHVSDLFTLEGIGGNAPVVIFTDNGEFKAVVPGGGPDDIPLIGGQAIILDAQRAATVIISGDAWANDSGTAAAPPATPNGIEVGDATLVLVLRGAVIDERTGLKGGFRVTVKNLSTGKAVAAVTTPDEMGYQLTIVDIETGQAATVGNVLEISAQSPNPFIGIEPLRYTVTAEEVKQSLIQLPELVAYEIPAETELLHNYPNPFNPETWIPYRLAEDAFVTLAIYDGGGQVVRTIDVGHQGAAVYESRSKAIYWDGRNQVGEMVASGVYFYHLSAGDYSATRKMMIIK